MASDGKGESVWLAWFLTTTLRRFAVHADARGDAAAGARCRSRADAYVAAAENAGWDGDWYRRAFFDDGTSLGSAADDECQIDAIAQSWAVLSGAANADRARAAMDAVNARLVRDRTRLMLLLTPPFDHTARDPGYIKGYPPGIRENGAQYTHAALWTVLAMTALGDGDRAGELMSLLNPFARARTRADADTYKVEPYVIAADVYAVAGHEGPWWLDVVHGFGELELPDGARGRAGLRQARQPLANRPLYPGVVAILRAGVQARHGVLRDRGPKPGWCLARRRVGHRRRHRRARRGHHASR